MARRTVNENDIDPFNAGEPIMPWDDPAALHDDASSCAFDETPYQAPSKRADEYVSPEKTTSTQTADAAGQRRSKRARKAERKVAVEAARKRGASVRPARSTGGRDAKRSPLRTVILLIVFISLASSLLGGLVSCIDDTVEHLSDRVESIFDSTEESSATRTDDYEPTPQTEFSDDEAAIRDLVFARLDSLGDDARWRGSARAKLDERLDSYLGYSSTELGIDGDAYVDWLLAHLSWSCSAAFAFDDEGSVYVDLTSPDAYEFFDELSDDTHDTLGTLDGKKPNAAQRQKVADAFNDLLDNDPDTTTHSLRFTAKPSDDGGWSLDEDEFYNELAYPLG